MKKVTFGNWIETIQKGIKRFPLTLFFLVVLASLFFVQINKKDIDIHSHTWAFFSLGVLLSLSITLFSENFKNIFLRLGIHIVGILLLMAYSLTLPEELLPVHVYQLIVIGLTLVFSTAFVSFFHRATEKAFWQFNKIVALHFIISAIFAQVIMIGLSLAVLSLKELFNVNIHTEVYQNLAVVCYVIFWPVYFLSGIPGKREKYNPDYTMSKFLKILGSYIMFPILTIYTVILYVYLTRIMVEWNLPNGWVSLLVSILALGGFLCMHILYPLRMEKKSLQAKLMSEYFAILLMPLLVLMTIGIFRRIDDYGLTINRLYVLILNIWLYGICFYLLVTAGKRLKWIVISFSVIAFLVSVGPWSVYNIVHRTLLDETGKLMSESHLLKNGKAINNSTYTVMMDSAKAADLSQKIEYLVENYGNKSLQRYFSEPVEKWNAYKMITYLGLIYAKQPKIRYFNARLVDESVVDIQNFKLFFHIQSDYITETTYNGSLLSVKRDGHILTIQRNTDKTRSFQIDLKPLIKNILSKGDRSELKQDELTTRTGDYILIINNVSGSYISTSDSVSINDFNAGLFVK